MAVPVAPSSSAHPSLQGGSAFLKIFGGDGLFFPFLFSEFYESIKRVDFVFEILDNEFDHDGIVEISEAGYTVGNQVIRVREIRECIQDSLSIFALEPPVLVPEHCDELRELGDATSDEFGSVGFFDFFEQAFGFSENDMHWQRYAEKWTIGNETLWGFGVWIFATMSDALLGLRKGLRVIGFFFGSR